MRKATKVIIITVTIVLTVILGFVSYFFVWGGKPYIENFEEVSADYKTVAQLVLNSYSELIPYDSYPENELIIVDIHKDNLKCDDYVFSLTDEQKKAVLTAGKKFGYLAVYKDAVFFRIDETGYYGLVYSKHPIIALYKAELPQNGRAYHRINSRWYEWGVWGI